MRCVACLGADLFLGATGEPVGCAMAPHTQREQVRGVVCSAVAWPDDVVHAQPSPSLRSWRSGSRLFAVPGGGRSANAPCSVLAGWSPSGSRDQFTRSVSGCGYARKCHLPRRSERLSVPLEPRRASARGVLPTPPLRLAADPVSVAIEAVWIRIRHIPADPELSMADLAAVEVRGRWRDANVRVRSGARPAWRRRRWRRRGRRRLRCRWLRADALAPQASATSLGRPFGTSVGAKPLEGAVVDVDVSEAFSDQLSAQVAVARKDDVGEKTPVAVSSGLGRIADQLNALAACELLCTQLGLCTETLGRPKLRRVDPDQADALAPPVREAHIDRVAVDSVLHHARLAELALVGARGSRRRTQSRKDKECIKEVEPRPQVDPSPE